MVEALRGGQQEFIDRMTSCAQVDGAKPLFGAVLFAEMGKPWTHQMVEALELLEEDHGGQLRCFTAGPVDERMTFQWPSLNRVPCNNGVHVVTVLLTPGAQEVGRVVGALPSEVVKLVQSQLQQPSSTVPLELKLRALVSRAPLMIFMKGTPAEPFCRFSRQLMGLFERGGVFAEFKSELSTFNIFDDEEVRQGLKAFSNWPTYPQIYLGGKLIGGVDVIVQLAESLESVSPDRTLGAELRRMLTEGGY